MFLMLYAGSKVDVCPCVALLSTQTAVNHRKVSVLFNRRCGKVGGNCELMAISFIPLCFCQCRRGADRTDGGDVILLLFMLRSHMVSIPVDMAELCMPDMSGGSQQRFRAGLFHTAAILHCYCIVRRH